MPAAASAYPIRRGAPPRGRSLRFLYRSLVFPGLRGLLGIAGGIRPSPRGTEAPPGAPPAGMSKRLRRVGFAALCLASLWAVYLLAANLAGDDGPNHNCRMAGQQTCSASYARNVLHKHKFSPVVRVHNPFVTWSDVSETLWGFIPLPPLLRTVDRLPYFSHGTERQYQALLRAIPDSTVPQEISRLPCKRCVVVGNGFVLTNSSLGKEIDSHHIVIRMNEAPVTGYELDVGSRTSLRICYPESAGLSPSRWGRDAATALLVFVPYKLQDLLWLRDVVEGTAEGAHPAEVPYLLWQLGVVDNVSAVPAVGGAQRPGLVWLRTGSRDKKQRVHVFWKNVTTRLSYRPERIRILRPDIIRSVAFNLLKFSKKKYIKSCRIPTTGLMALGLALHFCDEVSIAGFGYNMSAPRQPVHYYSNDTMRALLAQGGAHSILREQWVLRRLIASGAITDLSSSASGR